MTAVQYIQKNVPYWKGCRQFPWDINNPVWYPR